MNNGKCGSWTCDQTGWLMALGGAALGYVVAQMMGKQTFRKNPGGMILDVDGRTVHVRVAGLPQGTVGLYIDRPSSRSEDFIGTVQHTVGGMLRAFPPTLYEKLGVRSTLSKFVLDDGVVKKTLNSAASYLVGVYRTHYKMSRAAEQAYKRELGEKFDSIMGAA